MRKVAKSTSGSKPEVFFIEKGQKTRSKYVLQVNPDYALETVLAHPNECRKELKIQENKHITNETSFIFGTVTELDAAKRLILSAVADELVIGSLMNIPGKFISNEQSCLESFWKVFDQKAEPIWLNWSHCGETQEI